MCLSASSPCVKKITRAFLINILILIITLPSFAQQDKSTAVQQRLLGDKRIESVIVNKEQATPSLITLSSFVKQEEAPALLQSLLQTDGSTSFRTASSQPDKTGITVERLQQYYNNIKVEHAVYSVVERGGKAEAFTGSYFPLKNINVIPEMTEPEALGYAKAYVGARKYAWDQAREARDAETNPLRKQLLNAAYEKLFPKASLVIVQDYQQKNTFDLAFKFDIYAADPLTRGYVYVNAHTGKIMLYAGSSSM